MTIVDSEGFPGLILRMDCGDCPLHAVMSDEQTHQNHGKEERCENGADSNTSAAQCIKFILHLAK